MRSVYDIFMLLKSIKRALFGSMLWTLQMIKLKAVFWRDTRHILGFSLINTLIVVKKMQKFQKFGNTQVSTKSASSCSPIHFCTNTKDVNLAALYPNVYAIYTHSGHLVFLL